MSFIKKITLGILANAAALYAVTYFIAEVSYEGGWIFFVIGGFIIGVLNTMVKPMLKLISLPFVILSAGLFIFVINGVILYMTKIIINTADFFGTQFLIEGWLNFLIASAVFAVSNWLLHIFIKA